MFEHRSLPTKALYLPFSVVLPWYSLQASVRVGLKDLFPVLDLHQVVWVGLGFMNSPRRSIDLAFSHQDLGAKLPQTLFVTNLHVRFVCNTPLMTPKSLLL